jgi:hypothetical protein
MDWVLRAGVQGSRPDRQARPAIGHDDLVRQFCAGHRIGSGERHFYHARRLSHPHYMKYNLEPQVQYMNCFNIWVPNEDSLKNKSNIKYILTIFEI